MQTKLARMFEIEEAPAAVATTIATWRRRPPTSDDAVDRVLRTCFWLPPRDPAREAGRDTSADVIDLAVFRARAPAR